MTRSIFDPTHGDMEQEGWTFSPPAAEQISQRAVEADENLTAEKTDPEAAKELDAEHAEIKRIEDL